MMVGRSLRGSMGSVFLGGISGDLILVKLAPSVRVVRGHPLSLIHASQGDTRPAGTRLTECEAPRGGLIRFHNPVKSGPQSAQGDALGQPSGTFVVSVTIYNLCCYSW